MFKGLFGSNKIKDNIAKLSNKNTQIRLDATMALMTLASSESNRDSIREARGIAPLITLLKDSNTGVKQLAVLALMTVAMNETNKDAIREAEGIAPLIALLKDSDTEVKLGTVLALGQLAMNETNQDVIREAQGIVPLIALLKDSNAEVKKYAASALMQLANNTTNRDVIREARGIVPLIALLKDADAEAKLMGMTALILLANNATNRDIIREARGIVPLIALLEDPDAEVKQRAAAALSNLACNNPLNQAVILDNGAVPLLSNLAGTDENARKTLEACRLLIERRKNEQTLNMLASSSLSSANSKESGSPHRIESSLSQLKNPSPLPPEKPKKPSWLSSQKSPTAQGLTLQSTEQQGQLEGQELEKAESESKPEELSAKMEKTSLKPSGAVTPNIVPTITSSSLQIDANKRLGQGGFGIVYKGTWQMVTVAIKQLHATRLSAEALKAFEEEAQCHGLLRHPNTVMLFGVCVEPGRYSMVMEFMTGGSLYDMLHSSKDMPWSLRLSIANNISVGLYYLHENNIIHRDLKSLNVLLDEYNQAKLADFGLSTVKSETQSTTTVTTNTPGTIRWMAPELFKRGAKCTIASDIYALGWVFWELSSRKVPFQDEAHATNELIKDWVQDGEREAIPIGTPPQFAHLLTQCWTQRAEERPETAKTVAEALPTAVEEPNVSSGYAYYSKA